MNPSTLVIGVSGASARTQSVRAMMKQIGDEGATALFLPSHDGPASPDLARIDALVLMGNNYDIDPNAYIRRYPRGNPKARIHPETRSELSTPKSKTRARYENAMLEAALAARMPVLGICGGMQRLNVACGGTLHQHIPDLICSYPHMQHKSGIAPNVPVVPVIIKDQTLLASIAREVDMPFVKGSTPHCAKVIMENSMHHQSVDIIGAGLRACAMTDTVKLKSGSNGYLTEAIEADPQGPYSRQFILGVQWHPEFGASSLGQKIVQHLLKTAQEFTASGRKAGRGEKSL